MSQLLQTQQVLNNVIFLWTAPQIFGNTLNLISVSSLKQRVIICLTNQIRNFGINLKPFFLNLLNPFIVMKLCHPDIKHTSLNLIQKSFQPFIFDCFQILSLLCSFILKYQDVDWFLLSALDSLYFLNLSSILENSYYIFNVILPPLFLFSTSRTH